jgi:hypothetical protein
VSFIAPDAYCAPSASQRWHQQQLGRNSHGSNDCVERRAGFWCGDCRQRRHHIACSGRQLRQRHHQGRGGLRCGMVARPGRTLSSDGAGSLVPARLSPGPGGRPLLAEPLICLELAVDAAGRQSPAAPLPVALPHPAACKSARPLQAVRRFRSSSPSFGALDFTVARSGLRSPFGKRSELHERGDIAGEA